MKPYRVGIAGCGRMGGSIDDEVQSDLYRMWRPYSHAAAYASVPETVAMVAAADPKTEKLETLANRWNIPHRYTDYREMIEKEDLDIISVTTPATAHAEISIFAAEHKVKGIYCEKALCCSMAEADAMAEACRSNGVALNVGTLRRYHPGFEAMRKIVESGGIGRPQSVVHRGGGSLMHTASHSFDTILYLLGDPKVEFVQGLLDTPDAESLQDDRFESDPALGYAFLSFETGATAHIVRAGGHYDFEVIGESGRAASLNNGGDWELRLRRESYRFETEPFPAFGGKSPTVRCIEDLIAAIESGVSGHLETAYRGMAMSVAVAESHLRKGCRVHLPVEERALYIPSH